MKIINTFRRLFFLVALATILLSPAYAQQENTNLIPDASFEAQIPAWFETDGNSYYLAKNKIEDAPNGTHVLELSAWNEKGTKVLSPVFEIPAGAVSATLSVRATGAAADSKLALALFDEKGQKEIARFGDINLNETSQWKVLSGSVTTLGGKMRLVLLPSGASSGTVVELDKLGLFPGTSAGKVTDNVDWQVIEAETLANGKSWQKRQHTAAWYSGEPSGGYYLTGSDGIKAPDNTSVTTDFHIQNPGPHVLWLRLLYTAAASRKGAFSVELEQNGKIVAERTIESSDEEFRSPNKAIHMYWAWVSIKADLTAGTATVRLSRPHGASTWLARNIDLLLLTNLTNYTPDMNDFQPQIYVRWTNTGSGEPYCLYGFVHRNARPSYARPGMLTAAGFDGSIRVPQDKSKWIGPGQSTPWSNLSPYLLPAGDFNRVSLTATRDRHTDGFVDGRIQGTLEFALGIDKKSSAQSRSIKMRR